MLLADVHAHLEFFGNNVSAIVARAKNAGVRLIVTHGTDRTTNRQALELSKRYDIVHAALGLYPLEAEKMTEEQVTKELRFIRANKNNITAIGEIGLDYQESSDRAKQQRLFEQQLQLAKKLELPVIVHSRKAEQDVIATLKMHDAQAVLHAFHGSMKLVKEGVDAGFFFSVTANIGRSQHMQQLVKTAPLSRLLTETDAPFMAPEKDGKSEPAMVAATIAHIAAIKGTETEETANAVYANCAGVFARRNPKGL